MNTAAPTESIPVSASVDHRTSCHRCGNIRKNLHKCTECPQVFCSRCTEKMMEEHGSDIFFNGCPMCKEKCCCGLNKSLNCTRQFHCYKKCPTTRAGGINFGICTPPDAVKMTVNHVRYQYIRSGAPHVISCLHDDDARQSNMSAAKSEEHSKFSRCKNNNMTTTGADLYTYDSNNGTIMTDHGSTDDIERYFTSADGWDKTESPRSARLCSEEESSGPREYYYDSASSTSDKNTIIYIDSTMNDMYPFLTTPTPQTARSVLSPLTGTLLVGRTSSLPMPCTQDGHSRNARMSNSLPASAPSIDNNNRSAVAQSKVSIDFTMKSRGPLRGTVGPGPGPDVYGSYLGRSEIDQRTGRYDTIKVHQMSSNDVTNSEPLQSLMSSRSSSVARRGCRGRPLKSSYSDLVADIPPDSQDIRLGTSKGKAKKARITQSDSLLLSHGAGSIEGELPGLLEGFLSSNYFIKDDLNDMTGPFFMQTSFQCYPKVPSIGELVAKSTSVSIDPGSGLALGGKKRYRKHQASVSAKKLKIQQSAENNKIWSTAVRKKAYGSQTIREPAMKRMVVDPDCDDRMAGVYCEDTEPYTAPQDRVIWTALQGPGYSRGREDVTVGRGRAVTCDTIPYSDAKGSDMRYACHLPVSVCDADLTEREGYQRDITDHLKKDTVFNDAEDRSGQYIEQSTAPLQDVTSITSSRLDNEGKANHEARESAGCAYRSGPASHDADLERILRYAGEPPHVGAGSTIEYVGGVRDISQKPDEILRPLTPESVLLSIRSPAPASLISRAVDRVWYPSHFHDDGLNGAVRTEAQSDTVISTERRRADRELIDASASTPTRLLTEVLRGHWNSYRSIIPTFVPASSTGGTREVTPSVPKGMFLKGHSPGSERGLGLGVSMSSHSILSSGSEADPRRSPLSTTALAVDAGRLIMAPDPHYTGGDASASVTMENAASALLIPLNNVSYYGYSTLGHGFLYPPVSVSVPDPGQDDCTPTGSFTRLKSSNSANLGDLRVTYERADECTPSLLLSTPLLDNISFSPFMNFTPESDVRPSESRPMFGQRGGPGMKPYFMSTIPITRHTAHEDIFFFTQNANPSTADNTVVGATMGGTMDSNVGWLDDTFLYDLVAE